MKEYNAKDLVIAILTMQHVIDSILEDAKGEELGSLLTAMNAHNQLCSILRECAEVKAQKFTILPVVDVEVKSDGIEQ